MKSLVGETVKVAFSSNGLDFSKISVQHTEGRRSRREGLPGKQGPDYRGFYRSCKDLGMYSKDKMGMF